MPKLICMSHGMHFTANLSNETLTDGDIGCQERTKHYGSRLEVFSIFWRLFPINPIFLNIFEFGLISFPAF